MSDVKNKKSTCREYESDDLTIYWDLSLCSHSGKCTAILPEVFDMNKKPWISINAAQGEEIIKAIDACPSGALQYRVKENSNINPELAKGPGSLDYEETSPSEANPAVEIKVVNGGPFIIKGHTKLITSKGDIIREGHNMVLCRCAKSKNQPFCDGSHSRA